MKNSRVSKAVLNRLPKYYRILKSLKEQNISKVSSLTLASMLDLTPSQVRQDFNCFGGFGQQGYGYNVKYLYNEIGRILGLDRVYNMIIVGAGNLGQALANYVKFEKRGFWIKGIFDVNPRLKGMTVRGIEIRMTDELPQFIRDNQIQIAALTLPKSGAEELAPILVENGVKAIWNFAHTDLQQLPKDVIVESVHLSESLMQLSYNLNHMEREKEREL